MSKVEDFLTETQERAIIEAIRVAEKDSSGEIRVHLEKHTEVEPLERAKEVFNFLNMDKTQLKNGVLFYVAVEDKKFSVLGDKGIDEVVPDDFWTSVKDTVLEKFKKGMFTEGLEAGIFEAGKKLKQFFPYKKDDKNELDDSVSIG